METFCIKNVMNMKMRHLRAERNTEYLSEARAVAESKEMKKKRILPFMNF